MRTRICFFTNHFDFVREVIIKHYEKIFPKNIEMYLFCKEKQKQKFHLKRTKVVGYKTSKFFSAFELRKFCIQNKIDLVVNLSGRGPMAVALLLATLGTKTKSIFYFHGNPRVHPKNLIFFLSQFFTYKFLIGSVDAAEKVRRWLPLSSYKIFYQPHPFDISEFPIKNKQEARKKLKLPLKSKIIIFVGRITSMKGSDYLLKLIKQNPDKLFILLGKIYDDDYKKQKLSNTLIKTVSPSETADYYNASDLCVFLTKRDGYSYIPREAASCGTPSIISNLPSFAPINTPAIKKVPFDVGTIQKEIDTFFSLSSRKRIELGKSARKWVIENSSLKSVTPSLLKHYFEI